MNILFDKELRWRKVFSDKRRTVLPNRLGDLPMWENFDGYRVLVMGVEPPKPGDLWSCIITKHRHRGEGSNRRLLYRVIRLVDKLPSTSDHDIKISEMIESHSIPHGTDEAKGRGHPRHYGENPAVYSVKMPGELRSELEELATSIDVSLNRLVVTLIEIGAEHWDGEEIRY